MCARISTGRETGCQACQPCERGEQERAQTGKGTTGGLALLGKAAASTGHVTNLTSMGRPTEERRETKRIIGGPESQRTKISHNQRSFGGIGGWVAGPRSPMHLCCGLPCQGLVNGPCQAATLGLAPRWRTDRDHRRWPAIMLAGGRLLGKYGSRGAIGRGQCDAWQARRTTDNGQSHSYSASSVLSAMSCTPTIHVRTEPRSK